MSFMFKNAVPLLFLEQKLPQNFLFGWLCQLIKEEDGDGVWKEWKT